MNILVLTHEIPATSSMPGSPRLFNLCRFLSQNHRLSLLTGSQLKERRQWFLADPRTTNVFHTVKILPEEPIATWWGKQKHRLRQAPYFVTEYWKPEYYQCVRKLIHEQLKELPPIDLIYVDCLMMTQYVKQFGTFPVVADIHDSLTLLCRRLVEGEKQLLRKIPLYLAMRSIAKLERSLHKFCDLIITNSKVDEEVIRGLAPSGRTLTITNGVDVDYFSSCAESDGWDKLIFTGVMDYGPNEDAALYFGKEIFPRVKGKYPTVEFWVVGSDPTSRILSLASQPVIYVTGRVDDVRPYLQTAGIFVCPLRYGAGMKNKILAAMAMRKPVVATSLSLEGIEVRPGKEVLVADTADEFVHRIDCLIANRELRRHLGGQSHKLVTEKYSWNARGRVLDAALMDIAAQYGRPTGHMRYQNQAAH